MGIRYGTGIIGHSPLQSHTAFSFLFSLEPLRSPCSFLSPRLLPPLQPSSWYADQQLAVLQEFRDMLVSWPMPPILIYSLHESFDHTGPSVLSTATTENNRNRSR
jgi:hypothetical protein